jgi:hypothetical protein
MDLFHRQPLGPAKNRVILATAKERVNQAECVVTRQTGRGRSAFHPHTVLTRRRLRRLPTRQVLAEHFRRPAVELAP